MLPPTKVTAHPTPYSNGVHKYYIICTSVWVA
nr:MAG TPA: hypothetical protein [Caudoviricetes sp.]